MTPMLQKAYEADMALPADDEDYMRLRRCHAFEVTAVLPAARALAEQIADGRTVCEGLMFLPSASPDEPVWIEFEDESGGVALHLKNIIHDDFGAETAICTVVPHGPVFAVALRGPDWLFDEGALQKLGGPDCEGLRRHYFSSESGSWRRLVYALLAMINTPRAFGHREVSLGRHWRRQMVRRHPGAEVLPGRYHEILLPVAPPRDVAADEPERCRAPTGTMPYHWTRSYRRISDGRLVSSYWSGNPANGVIIGRYRLTPPENGVWPRF